jgi:hypothetical protein
MRRSSTWLAMAALLPAGTALGQGSVWLREFAPPQPVTVATVPYAGSFFSWSPELGLLRYPGPGPLHHLSTSCQVTSAVTPAEGGFDIAYQVTNPYAAPLPAPTLMVPGITLVAPVEFLSHAFGCRFISLVPQENGSICSPTGTYPDALYSPVMVLRDGDFAVSLSLQYPVLDYKQSVKMFAARWPNATDWTGYLQLQGTIPPATTRSYVVSVRYAWPDDWVHTLKAYRDYFWELYNGNPRYVQDRRPVYGASMSSESFFAPGNDRGFHPVLRPDVHGWKTTVDALINNVVDHGFERIMVWTPSGHYHANFGNNFPPQFMSGWSGPMFATASQFARIRNRGVQLCFWWGHSGRYADRWDDDALELFDPANPVHRAAMLQEWTLATALGADGAGLDAFEELPLWTALSWMATLFQYKSDAFLVAESACADIMHLFVPFWIQGNDLQAPHLMADYLVPGREIWVHLAGGEVTPERIEEVTSWGLTVCVIGMSILSPDYDQGDVSIPGQP